MTIYNYFRLSERRKPLWDCCFIFLLTCTYLFFFARVQWRIGDEGTLVYGAQRVAEGAVPFRDFIEPMGPLSFYWLGLFFKLFGTHLVVARTVLVLTGAFTALTIYWITHRLRSGGALLPAVFYALISVPLWPATSHHWDSNLFALLAFASFLEAEKRRSKLFLVASGILAGLTSCFMPQKGLFILLAFLTSQWLCRLRAKHLDFGKAVNFGTILVPYFAVGGLVLLFFFSTNGLEGLLFSNIIWPLSNYHEVNRVPYAYGLFEFFWQYWSEFFRAIFPLPLAQIAPFVVLIPILLIPALPILVLIILVKKMFFQPLDESPLSPPMISCWITGSALFLSEMHRCDVMHLVFGSPLLLVIFHVWLLEISHTNPPRKWVGKSINMFALSLILFSTLQLRLALSATHRIETRRGVIYTFSKDEALIFLLANTKAKDQVFIYPYYPMYYFLVDISNPTKYSILVYNYNTKNQFTEAIESLKNSRNKYVLWDEIVSGENLKKWFPNYRIPKYEEQHMERYLESEYIQISNLNHFRILAPKMMENY